MSIHPSSGSYDRIWEDFLTRVSTLVTKQTLETWFKPMRLGAIEENAITIECPNKFFMDWVDEHHKDKISYVFRELLEDEPAVFFKHGNGSPEDYLMRRVDIARPQPVKKPNGQGGEPLNPKYVFDEFVQGSNSRLTYAACRAVAENPANAYNPLFIYGGVGLGKTHLMQASGH